MGRPSFHITKMTTNGRISVPLCIREKTGWEEGEILEFEVIDPDTVVVFKRKNREERMKTVLEKGANFSERHKISTDDISEVCSKVRKDLYSELYG
jgi:AbrB family looped-hinge helix DNA binding protein